MRIVFLFFGIGLVAVVYSGLGLAWDGAYQLAGMLESGATGVAFGRYSQLPLLWTVLFASRYADNAQFLMWLFGALHAALPLLALAGVWWTVRQDRPAWFVWAAFGIALVTLPAQACLVCQSLIMVQFAWVVVAAIVAVTTRNARFALIIISPFILFLHPLSILVFGLGAIIALMRKENRWAIVFLLLCIAAIFRTWIFQNAYESNELTWQQWQRAFDLGVAGYPMWSLVFGWSAALFVFAESRVHRLHLVLRVGAFLFVAAAFLVLGVWVLDSYAWANAMEYRDWAFFLSLPIFGLALFDGATNLTQFRLRIIQLLAMGFAAVLLLQSAVWADLTQRLRLAINESNGCVEARHVEGIPHTAMGGWSITSYGLLVQGKSPRALVYFWDSCAEEKFALGYWLAHTALWDHIGWGEGWFDKRAVKQSLVHTACEFFPDVDYPEFPMGWYEVDFDFDGWERWMLQEANLRVDALSAMTAQLRMETTTEHGAKQIALYLNQSQIVAERLEGDETRAIEAHLDLRQGRNEIVVKVDYTDQENHLYPPALSVRNLQIAKEDETLLCP